ncbi:reverse transcriptase domain-containing protein [Tanacetum coccineum]
MTAHHNDWDTSAQRAELSSSITSSPEIASLTNMTTHHNYWDTSAQRGESSSSTTSSSEIAALTQQMAKMRNDMLQMYRLNQQVNSVTLSCESCGGPHSYYECQAVGGHTQDVYSTTGNYNSGGNVYQPPRNRNLLSYRSNNFLGPPGVLPSNTIPNPREDIKVITTLSGMTFVEPKVSSPPPSSSKEVERDHKTITDQVLTKSTTIVPPTVVQPSPASRPFELPPFPASSYVIPEQYPHQPRIPYPSSFPEALAYMLKYAKLVKDLLTNKEKLLELFNTPLNENCSAVLLKKLPEKLGDTGKFLIPCEFQELESCMALADLGASINLMPLFVWKKLILPELTPTRMTLELATRTVAYPTGIAEDVFVQVGKFTFLADFVVVDYDVDP